MGTDKSMLRYHEKIQRYHVYDLLNPFCEKVFISGTGAQSVNIEHGYPFLADDPAFIDIGPVAALLTAFTQFPGKNILLTGCDYPFLTADDLRNFSEYCKGDHAVSFYNEPGNRYEPMLAWYPYPAMDKLKNMEEAGEYSLQHYLKVNRAVKFYPSNKKSIRSIDTPADFTQAAAELISDRQFSFSNFNS